MVDWKNRIVGQDEVPPDSLLAHPKNWRIHPDKQQRALTGALNDIGWIQRVIVSKRSGFVIDGHLRVSLAISSGQTSIPVEYVDLSEAEEAEALATLDPIAALAATDREQLGALMADIEHADVAVSEMLAEMYDANVMPQEAQQNEETWKSRYEIVVECMDETHQEEVFESLSEQGYKCRVLSM